MTFGTPTKLKYDRSTPRLLASTLGKVLCKSVVLCLLASAPPLLTMETNKETLVSEFNANKTKPLLGMIANCARFGTSIADEMNGAAREAFDVALKLCIIVITKLVPFADKVTTEQSKSEPQRVR